MFLKTLSRKEESLFTPHSLSTERRIYVVEPGKQEVRPLTQEAFYRYFGVTYISRPIYSDRTCYRRIKEQSERAFQREELREENKWLGVLYKDKISTGFINAVVIKWIDKTIGWGLFALQEIQAGEFIGQYTGLVRRRYFFFPKINDYCFSYPTSRVNWIKHTIDAERYGNEIRFANHSDQPNCESVTVWHEGVLFIILRAKQAILEGEQLTYDYSEIYWRSRQKLFL